MIKMAVRKFEITVGTIYAGTDTTETVELDTSDFASEYEIESYLWELIKRKKEELVDGIFEEIFEN